MVTLYCSISERFSAFTKAVELKCDYYYFIIIFYEVHVVETKSVSRRMTVQVIGHWWAQKGKYTGIVGTPNFCLESTFQTSYDYYSPSFCDLRCTSSVSLKKIPFEPTANQYITLQLRHFHLRRSEVWNYLAG